MVDIVVIVVYFAFLIAIGFLFQKFKYLINFLSQRYILYYITFYSLIQTEK